MDATKMIGGLVGRYSRRLRAYTGRLPSPITTADLNSNDPRIVRQVAAYFRTNNIASGKFDHLKPTRVLLREQAQLPTLSNDTL